MGLKDWGEGLEELTESYYRYANQRKGETWFVTNGVIGERRSNRIRGFNCNNCICTKTFRGS